MTGVLPQRRQPLPDIIYGIDTGEDDPPSGNAGGAGQGGVQFGVVVQGGDCDGGQFHRFGAQFGKQLNQPGRLGAGAGHQNPFAPQRAAVEPGDLVPQSRHRADDGDYGGADAGFTAARDNVGQGSGNSALAGPGAPLHQGHGRVRGHTVGLQGGGDAGQIRPAHQHDDGAAGLRQGGPVGGRVAFGGILAAGDDGYGGGDAAMGDGDAGVSGGGYGRGYAGDDFKGDAGGGQGQGFLAAASEYERIAALQPGYRPSGQTFRYQQIVDFGLGQSLPAPFLADENAAG